MKWSMKTCLNQQILFPNLSMKHVRKSMHCCQLFSECSYGSTFFPFKLSRGLNSVVSMALAPRPSCPIFPWPTASTCTFDIWARLPRKRATSELTAPTKAYLATRRQQEFVFRPDGHLLEVTARATAEIQKEAAGASRPARRAG